MAGGFFRIVPPSGESQLKPSSTDDIADDDFSLKLPELVDRLERFEAGFLTPLPLLPLKMVLSFLDWTSLASDICRAESKLLLSLESGVLTASLLTGVSF